MLDHRGVDNFNINLTMGCSASKSNGVINITACREGLRGVQGIQGEQGETGPEGPQGPQGPSVWGGIEGDIEDQEDLINLIESTGSTSIQNPEEILPSAILVHDDMTGIAANYAASATRTSMPGPGTMTAGAVPSTSTVRYENNELLITPMPSGTGQVFTHWGAQTIAAGLTIKVRLIPAGTPGTLGQTRVGFSEVANAHHMRRGSVLIGAGSPYTQLALFTSTLDTDTSELEYFYEQGTIDFNEEIAVVVHFKTPSHQQFWIQGGRYGDEGAAVGSNNWHMIGETFLTLSGTVYPGISTTFNGTTRVRDVQVLSSWNPSPRHQTFDYSRTKIGVHIATFGRDPVTDLVVMGWNNSAAHIGPGMSTIRYSVKLATGVWTDAADLIAAPTAPAGQCIGSLSSVNGSLRLIYWKNADGADGGTLYWRTVTINPATGAATLGTETLLGVNGTGNLTFSQILTLPSGRLLIPYHKNAGSPLLGYVSYSDNNGSSWTEGVLSASPPAGVGWTIEPTIVIESDGGIGCYIRSSGAVRVAYYTRCADPNAVTLIWSTPVPINSVPQPGATGARMQVAKLTNGQIMLVGYDASISRRNITVWSMGDNGVVLGKVRIADANASYVSDENSGCLMQYPAIIEDGEDLIIAYTHLDPGSPNANLSDMIRLHTWRWNEAVAKEVGGTGKRSEPRPATPRRIPDRVALTYSTAPVPDMAMASLFDLRLTASTAVVGVPLNPSPGQRLGLIVTQAGSGSYTLAFNSVFEFAGTAPQPPAAVGRAFLYEFMFNGFTGKWVYTGQGSVSSLTTARTIGGSSFDGTGNVTSFPVPGPIGGTTPSTAVFTTVSGNGAGLTGVIAASAAALTTPRTIGGSSFDGTSDITSFPAPGAIGATTPSTGAFTTIGTNGMITVLLSGSAISPAAGNAALFQGSTVAGTSCHITIAAGTTGESRVYFADTANSTIGGISYMHTSDTMVLRTGGSVRFTLGATTAVFTGTVSTPALVDPNVVITPPGTTGAQSINAMSGSVNFASAATSLVVTNASVTTGSRIFVNVATNDGTMKGVRAVAAAGSFTIRPDVAPTGETRVDFFVVS